MNSMVILKEKDDKHVVYYYSGDSSHFKNIGEILSDGEIDFVFETEEFEILKTATYDEDGLKAQWVLPHLWRTIVRENCPDKRFIATG